ncbi:ribose 5-phosphate isomerase A [Deinobacterium chartae]|uniref:Ribose-5-phosphate isomerase A n=1 Tax=Deinobacterium chartae TaxID=521158 RepID=A0A841HY24_9DEIO|nr:ribose 5-phosphate isomerase A [Deinobacterium chartae]MBB6097110.1 ribose 5-phosphate isomerase A [Deinobacterium chartae]
MDLEALKREAAHRAVDRVESGMRVGLGTGSTARYAILEIARRVGEGRLRAVSFVATSLESERLAQENGLVVDPLDPRPLDVAIDGADEISPQLDLVKGLGGALLREKLVEVQARRFVVIADHTKQVARLGERAPLPVEIVRFGAQSTLERLAAFGEPALRLRGNEPFVTDNGNFIADLRIEPTAAPADLEVRLKALTGVVETGLFLGMATEAIIALPGGVKELVRPG